MRIFELLTHPTLQRQKVFSTGEAEKILGWPRRNLNPLLFRLVRTGRLARIKRGLFCIEPAGAGTKQGYSFNWYLIARSLAGTEDYFMSHYSAMHLHGMTTESIQTIFLSLPTQHAVPAGLRIPLRFVTVPKKRFWGLEEKWVTNEEKVFVSDPERTVIDALDRPDLAGGIMEIARGLWLVKQNLRPEKLCLYAWRFGSYAAARRLGFLMELLGIGPGKEFEKMKKWALHSRSYVLLDPTLEKRKKHLRAWRLVLNIDPDEIKRNLMT